MCLGLAGVEVSWVWDDGCEDLVVCVGTLMIIVVLRCDVLLVAVMIRCAVRQVVVWRVACVIDMMGVNITLHPIIDAGFCVKSCAMVRVVLWVVFCDVVWLSCAVTCGVVTCVRSYPVVWKSYVVACVLWCGVVW